MCRDIALLFPVRRWKSRINFCAQIWKILSKPSATQRGIKSLRPPDPLKLKTELEANTARLEKVLLYDSVVSIFVPSPRTFNSSSHSYDFISRPINYTARKMKFSIKVFFSKCDQIRRKLRIWADLVTFTEEILNRKLHFLCINYLCC